MAPVPGFTVTGTAVSVSPGATSGNTSTISITPSGGFTDSVTLTAAVTNSPAGAEYPPILSFGTTSPVTINGATAGTATLTISTTAPAGSASRCQRPGVRWSAASGVALACLLLFGIPSRRRTWLNKLGMLALLLTLAGGLVMVAAAEGTCGGGGGGGGGIAGTTAGSYTVIVTGTSGTTTETGTVTLTVQ